KPPPCWRLERPRLDLAGLRDAVRRFWLRTGLSSGSARMSSSSERRSELNPGSMRCLPLSRGAID
ncbi:hypothetical protein NZA98_03275, partial [Escherichia coli]|nr:hypothetical protein [Escherichia coli]